MYISPEGCTLDFESTKFDYDTIGDVLNLRRGIPDKNSLTRVITAKTKEELYKYIKSMIGTIAKVSSGGYLNSDFEKNLLYLNAVLNNALKKLK